MPGVLHRMRNRFQRLAIGLLVLAPALLRAHEVIVEQTVAMTVQPRDGRLSVQLHIPAPALGGVQLPKNPDGTLDPARLDEPLRIVAADTARSLDLQQHDVVLAQPVATARLGADRASIDVELIYQTAD